MCFRGVCKFPSIETIKGTFANGLLDGSVTIVGAPQKYFETHAKIRSGVLHGRLASFGAKPLYDERLDKTIHLSIIKR